MNKEKFWHFVYWLMLVIISALLGAILTLLVISLNKKDNFYKGKTYYLIQDTVYLHDTIFLKKPNKKRTSKTNTTLNDGLSFKCDSATKAFNVMYWKTQCERIKHHNEVLPEETEPLPILSADSCLVEFLY